MLLSAILLLTLLGESSALPQHTQRFESALYEQRARADPDATFHLAVGLHVHDFDALERKLWQVADPLAPEYGQHLSRTEVDALARPHDGALDAVRRWLQPVVDPRATDVSAIGAFSPASNILTVALPVKHVERLLNTAIYEYERPATATGHTPSRVLRAADTVTIPSHLHSVVAFVNANAHPLGLRALAAMATDSVSATDTVSFTSSTGGGTLARIRALYGIPDALVATHPRSTQAVPSFYSESWSPSDLTKFFHDFLPGSPIPTIVERGSRPNKPEKASTEASLDLQYLTGVARNATTFVWTMNGSNPFSPMDEPFVAFADAVLALDAPPLVVSISYSDDEAQIFRLSPAYAQQFDALLIKMGLRGISVLVASGDDGVAGLRPEFAKLSRNETCLLAGPQWPSSSPYITSVGATMVLAPTDFAKDFLRTADEVVCSGEAGGVVTSGGGFSNVYPIPAYQQRAVDRYLTTSARRIPKTPGFFNRSGRAYPDIAALGASFHTYIHGYVTSVSGTSASTPVVGGMVTLWNDARLNAGKRPLGFLNPLLYHLNDVAPEAFHDVVVGNNGARKGGNLICSDSFGAAGGWDAATGVGTPNFRVIRDFVLALGNDVNWTAATLVTPTTKCDPLVVGTSSRDGAQTDRTGATDFSATTGPTGASVIGTVVLALVVAAAAVVGAALLTVTYKRWRNQYTSLSADVATRDAANSPGQVVTRGGGIDSHDDDDDGDGDDDREGVELSEISLHE